MLADVVEVDKFKGKSLEDLDFNTIHVPILKELMDQVMIDEHSPTHAHQDQDYDEEKC